jgi:hypothetical protein
MVGGQRVGGYGQVPSCVASFLCDPCVLECPVLQHTKHQSACGVMQGNCAKPPPAIAGQPPLQTLLPKQCVIQTPGTLLKFPSDSAKREPWIGNLYIRLTRQGGANSTLMEWTPAPKSKLWMTNVTLQGDGKKECNGIRANGAPFLWAGTFLHNLSALFWIVLTFDPRTLAQFRTCPCLHCAC